MQNRRPAYVVLTSGILLSLSQCTTLPGGYLLPQAYLGWLAWFGFVPLFCLIHNRSYREIYLYSFWTFVVYYSITLYWLTIAMSVYGGLPWILSVLILVAFGCLLGFFMAPSILAGFAVSRMFSISAIWVLPLTFSASEYLRFYSLTGYPWGNLGQSQVLWNHPLVQVADITGMNGVAAILMAANVLIFRWLKKIARLPEIIFFGVILVGAYFYGMHRLNSFENTWRVQLHAEPTLRVAALQGNISQNEKWDRAFVLKIIQRYVDLLGQAVGNQVDLAVWPEASFPLLVERDTPTFPLPTKVPIHQVIGAPAMRKKQLFNSAFLLGPNNQVLQSYDKTHLVPFGEYVPQKRILFFVDRLVPAIDDFTPGKSFEPLVMETNGQKWSLGILNCYEDVFPNNSRQMALRGADLLVNLTNDAWYAQSPAAYQHLGLAVFRSIETRLPTVRATNTGITAVIKPSGLIQNRLPWFQPGILTDQVARMRSPQSFYVRHSEWFSYLCVVILWASLAAAWVAWKVPKNPLQENP